MHFSLVLATIGRPAELKRFLNSLVGQDFRCFEVIVVDQSRGGDALATKSIVEIFAPIFDVSYIYSEQKGLSRARNIGLMHASGDVVGFPDDDCWYSPAFLKDVAEVFLDNRNSAYVCGQYTEPGTENPSFSRTKKNLKEFKDARVGSSVTLFLNLKRIPGFDICFDEMLGAGALYPAGEETDLMSRLLLAGHQGTYDPKICAYHKIERPSHTLESWRMRERAYGFWMGKHARKLPALTFFCGGLIKLALYAVLGRRSLVLVKDRFVGFKNGIRKSRN